MKELKVRTKLYGYPIEAFISVLDEGLHVLLVGGCRTHVGAVSRAVPGQETETVQYPSHREGTVSERWASRLSEVFRCPAVVCCGIHYDHVSKEEIRRIVTAAEDLLERAIDELKEI